MANEQAQAFIDQATQSLQNSQFQQALDLVDQAIAIEPNVSDSHVLRGICLSQLGQPDAATEAFRKAIMISPYNAKAYYNLAVHMNSQGKKKEAIELAREAVGVDPRHSSARSLLQQLEAEFRGEPQAPSGANIETVLSNDPLAAPPSGAGAPAAPSAPSTPSGGVIEPNLPPRNQPAPPMSRPEGPGGPPPSGPAGVQSPVGSPYSANYQRGGYVQSAHSLPWVENMEPAWTIIGWALTALSFIILMAAIGTFWSTFQTIMAHGPNSVGAGQNIGFSSPLGIIGLVIRLLCLLWIIFDVVDRKTSWFWVVLLVVLGCCCASPWLILPFYIGLGRKGSN